MKLTVDIICFCENKTTLYLLIKRIEKSYLKAKVLIACIKLSTSSKVLYIPKLILTRPTGFSS